MKFSHILFLAGIANIFVSASPSPTTPHQANKAIIEKRAICTPTSLGDTQQDDTPSILSAITTCGNGGTIVFPAGVTYSLRSMLEVTGCIGCEFQLEGTLKASDDTTYWATQSAIISLNDIVGCTFHSLTGTGVIDGNGQSSYDQYAVATFARPTVLYISGGSDISVAGFKVKNPPNVFIAQKGNVTNIDYASLTMTAASKSTNAPVNTDGFDIGESTYTTINNVYISNQDDCIAFKSGANYVTVETATCAGTNHGTVVGSLGKDNADYVTNVYVHDLTMINCGKAAGIKVYPGGSDYGTATVTNVTWDGVVVDGCEYAVQIQSCYGSDASTCADSPSEALLTEIYFKNFTGTTNTQMEPVTGNINCPAAGTCDLYFSDWDVVPPNGTAVIECDYISNDDPGITCVEGASG